MLLKEKFEKNPVPKISAGIGDTGKSACQAETMIR